MVRYTRAMKPLKPEVWDCEHEIEVNAAPEVIWSFFRDVAGWTRWNAGIEKIEIRGPFEADTEFVMTPPGQDALLTRLVEVRENAGFVDETQVGELSIFVDHRIEVIEPGRSRVVYALEAFGPGCEEIGAAVSADFPEVLRALAALAESTSCSCIGKE
jgi:Polyketide cyclase / dehydrase and lipid transport